MERHDLTDYAIGAAIPKGRYVHAKDVDGR